jgi:hypothetical protein
MWLRLNETAWSGVLKSALDVPTVGMLCVADGRNE